MSLPTTWENIFHFHFPSNIINANLLFSLSIVSNSCQHLSKSHWLIYDEDFKILKYNMTNIELLLRKSVYPYKYFSSMYKFHETSLPSCVVFFNDLMQQHISEEDYAHAQVVRDTFDLQTLRHNHDLYVKYNVLQLSDAFQNFCKLFVQFYGLDCVHFLTASCFMSQQLLKLLRDVEMHLMVECVI